MCICACARPYPQVVVVGCLQLLQLLGQLCALEAEVHGTLQAGVAVNDLLGGKAAQRLCNILYTQQEMGHICGQAVHDTLLNALFQRNGIVVVDHPMEEGARWHKRLCNILRQQGDSRGIRKAHSAVCSVNCKSHPSGEAAQHRMSARQEGGYLRCVLGHRPGVAVNRSLGRQTLQRLCNILW